MYILIQTCNLHAKQRVLSPVVGERIKQSESSVIAAHADTSAVSCYNLAHSSPSTTASLSLLTLPVRCFKLHQGFFRTLRGSQSFQNSRYGKASLDDCDTGQGETQSWYRRCRSRRISRSCRASASGPQCDSVRKSPSDRGDRSRHKWYFNLLQEFIQ